MDIGRLIEEVRSRPVLYDCRIAGYTRKMFKPQLWHEVAVNVSDDWTDLDSAQRSDRVIDVQKRWRTLRDNFKRELNYQQQVEMGEIPATKRKKYIYFDQLHFLEPIMLTTKYPEQKEFKEEECEQYEEEAKEELERDADELFLLSLLPTLRALDLQSKSLAKLRLLQALHEVAFPEVGAVGPPPAQHVIGPIVLHCPQPDSSPRLPPQHLDVFPAVNHQMSEDPSSS